MYKSLALIVTLSISALTHLQAQSNRLPPSGIRIDQLGFYPQAPKLAVISYDSPGPASTNAASSPVPAAIAVADNPAAPPFFIISVTTKDTVFKGRLGPLKNSANSSLQTRIADFGAVEKEGIYIVAVPGTENSGAFRIGKEVLRPVVAAALKGYYYQRSGMPLDPAHAGKWSRPAGHPDNEVLIHPSAVSAGRPAGTVISTPGGWYDAGDYNKYIVNSGITMGTLLSAYEDFPGYFDGLHTNIPDDATAVAVSGNAMQNHAGAPLPDILKECLYNLRWMLSMQDPSDGGVYNKCTNAAFDGMVMPGVTKEPRWVVQKGTAATLDFAAVAAQAGRILRKFKDRSALSDSCFAAAAAAWQWAVKNPALVYDQNAINRQYEPKISTGAYGDRDFRDEWFWAAAELLVSSRLAADPAQTANRSTAVHAAPAPLAPHTAEYQAAVEERINDSLSIPSWANVHMLGNYTLLRHKDILPGDMHATLARMRQRLLGFADRYLEKIPVSAFHTVMGQSPRDFVWGSSSVAANQGILLVNAWLQTSDKKYLDNALGNLDYLLGRNATGYCFVTGMGTRSTMHPHHRPSVADGIAEPVPGLLAGGPNPGRQDHSQYEFTEPETAYLDKDAAYASNEIAINWNAPLVYLSAAIEALQYKGGYSRGVNARGK